jgi:hypothetical protein
VAQRGTTIAIDGGGMTTIRFDIGRMAGIQLSVGPNKQITIADARPEQLKAGQCSQNWFRIPIEEGTDKTLISVLISTDNDSSMNFMPDGLAGYHIPPGNTEGVGLIYTRDSHGNLNSEAKGLKEPRKK